MNLRACRYFWLSMALVCFLPFAQGAVNLSEALPTDPLVKTGTLSNGLRYYIRKNDKPADQVEMRLVVKAGSVLEDVDQRGVAHVVEHMAFNGSRHFKRLELVSYLQAIGMSFGNDTNAYTDFNETVYRLSVPLDKPQHLEMAFLVLQDWAQGLQMSDQAIEKERAIVLEELRMRDGVDLRMRHAAISSVLRGTPYADRMPIGTRESLAAFSYDAVRRFYTDWYRPELMALVVAGDIDPERVAQRIEAVLGPLRNPVNARVHPTVQLPVAWEARGQKLVDPGATQSFAELYLPMQPKPAQTTLADYRSSLIRRLAWSLLSEDRRWFKVSRTSMFRGHVVHGFGLRVPGYEDPVVLGVSSVEGGIERHWQRMLERLAQIRRYGYSAEEVNFARASLLYQAKTRYRQQDDVDSSGWADQYLNHFVYGDVIAGPTQAYAFDKELLPGITANEVNAVVRNLLAPNPSVPDAAVVLYVSKGEESENDVSVQALVDGLRKTSRREDVPAPKPVALPPPVQLMKHLPAAGRIVKQVDDPQLGLFTLTLSNGVQVVLKPTAFKTDEVVISASRLGGWSLYGDADALNAMYAADLASYSGLGDLKSDDFLASLRGKSAWVKASLDMTTESIVGKASQEDLETLFQLLHLRMTAPGADPIGWWNWRLNTRLRYPFGSDDDGSSAWKKLLNRTLWSAHPRGVFMQEVQDLAKIDPARSTAIYRERFGSAKGLTFNLVGNFDVESIKPLVATYVASLPTPDIPVVYRDVGMRFVTGVVKKELRVGRGDGARVGLSLTGPTVWTPQEEARVKVLVDVLNLRLTDVLRGQLQLIYAGGADVALLRQPREEFRIDVGLPCAVTQVDKVVKAFWAEVARLQSIGPSEEDLQKIKANRVKNLHADFRSNDFWSEQLRLGHLYQRDPTPVLTLNAAAAVIQSLTPAQIRKAAQHYLNKNNHVQVVLLPKDGKNNQQASQP